MRRTSLLLVLVLTSATTAQRLETTIWLPDTLTATVNLAGGFAVKSGNRVYLHGGGGGYLAVLDGASSHRVGRLRSGMGNYSACSDPVHNRIYSTNHNDGTITATEIATGEARTIGVGSFGPLHRPMALNVAAGRVYVGTYSPCAVVVVATATNTIVSTIPLASNPRALAINSVGTRVYCQSDNGNITVFNGAGDSVLMTIGLRGWGENLCFNADGTRLYAIHADTLAAIDPATGAVLRNFRDWVSADGLCYNSADDKLYVAGSTDGRVFILPGSLDTVVAEVAFGPRPDHVAYCAATNEVYASDYHTSTICVISGSGDTVVARIAAGPCDAFVFDPPNGRNYCLGGNEAVVVDAATHAILDRVSTGESPTLPLLSAAHDQIAVLGASRLMNIDGATNELVGTLRLPGWVVDLVYDERHDWFYGLDFFYNNGTVSYVSGTGDSVLRQVVIDTMSAFCLNPVSDKFYATYGQNHVAVFDVMTGNRRAELPTASYPYFLAFDSRDNKVYCAGQASDTITVIDGAADTIIRAVPTGHWFGGLIYVPELNKLYCPGQESRDVTVIDCDNDSVLGYFLLPNYANATYYHAGTNTMWFAVANGVQKEIDILDCSTDSIIEVIDITGTPWGLAGTDAGAHVYLGTADPDAVTIYDGASRSVVTTIPIEGRPTGFAWNPAHGRVYVADPSGSRVLVICDTATVGVAGPEATPVRRPEATICRGGLPLSGRASGLLFSTAGRRAAELHPGPNNISALAPGVYFLRRDGERDASRLVLVR